MKRVPVLALALTLTAVFSTTALAVQAPEPGTLLPNYDARQARGQAMLAAFTLRAGGSTADLLAGPAVEPGELRQAAALSLEHQAGSRLVQRWDTVTGSPRLIFASEGHLSKPDSRSPEVIARDFLLDWASLFLMTPDEAVAMEFESQVPLGGGGAVVRFHQHYGTQAVDHGHVEIGIDGLGRVLHVGGAGVIGSLQGGLPRYELATGPRALSASDALITLALHVGVQLPKNVSASATEKDGSLRFDLPDSFAQSAYMRETVVHTVWGPRRAWRTTLAMPSGLAMYDLVLDDSTRQLIRMRNLTMYADTRGRAFRVSPVMGPHEIIRFPDTEDFRSDISPDGWADADMTEGNNTTVREDRDGDNEVTPGAQATANPAPPYIFFDSPYTADPAADLDAGLIQLFFAINDSHQRFYELGFDEASGNFQRSNFGRAGLEQDPVLGDSQDGSGTNNANFSPAADGIPGRMQMFIWDTSGELRDSSFDVGVVMHEYAHGVSTRLVGGPADPGCLAIGQGGAMGEGWSDYYAVSWLEDQAVGAWISGNPAGIREFHLDDNPPDDKTYAQYCAMTDNDLPDSGFCEPHASGEIWSGFLWKVREAFVATYGEEGKEMADRLILEGMKLTICQPSMLDARDGILLADRQLFDGNHACLIREAARSRGMGFSATSGDSNDAVPVAATDAWPDCVDTGTVGFVREGLEVGAAATLFGCVDEVKIRVVDGDAGAGPLAATLTSSITGDSELISLAAGLDPAVYSTTITTDDANPAMVDDGALQVQDGDVLTVTYTDATSGMDVVSTAEISCTARIELLSHRFTASTCDADDVPGFPGLPGFLDQGESADLQLTVGNLMAVPVDGLFQVSTDRADLFTILPGSPVPGSLPAAKGATPGSTVLTLRVRAVDDFMGATDANIMVNLLAPGYDPAAVYTLPLQLNRDYEHVTGLSVDFDVETETDVPAGPNWSTGAGSMELGWSLVTCNAAPGSTKAYRSGPADCGTDYTDDTEGAYLASPDLNLAGPDTVAARLTQVDFVHDIDLAVTGFPPFVPNVVDADGVGLVVSTDPASEDVSNPFGLFGQALAVYANVPDFGFDSNTADWEPESLIVEPGQLNVDLLQPAYLTWFFLTDVTLELDGLDAQAEGYYVDDVTVSYELVNSIPSAAACMADATPYSIPFISDPVSGVACSMDAVQVDASLSDAEGCGILFMLEYRFLVDGAVVPCFDDAAALFPRVQDVDGWGASPLCYDFPDADTTYTVETRCMSVPDVVDSRETSVRILDGTAILTSSPAAFCASGTDPVTVDASTSVVAGCTSGLIYAFTEVGGGAFLDCDGDGMPDGPSTSPTCELAHSVVDFDVELHVSCEANPTCEFVDVFTITSVQVVPVAEEVNPAAAPYCPDAGALIPVTAENSNIVGCDAGIWEYRWTGPGGADSGWSADPTYAIGLADDGDLTLEARCSLDPACVNSTTLSIDMRDGDLTLASTVLPEDCVGDPMTLTAEDLAPPEPVQCMGTLEYRFLADGMMLDCDGDMVPDDFSAATSCDTLLVDGGADYTVEVRCVDDPTCVISSAAQAIAPRPGWGVGTVEGTLMVSRTGDCTAGGDVVLDWSDSDYVPPYYVVLRGDSPTLDPISTDLTATTFTDVGAVAPGCVFAGMPYRGSDVYFYNVRLRNDCTGEVGP